MPALQFTTTFPCRISMSKQEYFTYVEMKDNNNSFSLPHFKWTEMDHLVGWLWSMSLMFDTAGVNSFYRCLSFSAKLLLSEKCTFLA